MNICLSKLSRPELRKLYNLLNDELRALKHPNGFCEIDCTTCPHNGYCKALSDAVYDIEKDWNSRPG